MKRLLIITVIFIMSIGTAFGTGDTEIQEDILERIEEELEDLDDSHKDYVNQKNETIRNIRSLEDSVRNTEAEIEDLKIKIEDNKVQIGIATMELEAAKQALMETTDLLDERIRIMYMNGTVGYLEVVLDSKNFEDLLSRIDMLSRIVESDTALIDQMEIDKNLVDEKKQNLETEREKLVTLEGEMQVKKDQLEVQIANLEVRKAALEKDIEALEIEIEDANEDAEKVKKIIADLKSREVYVGGEMMWPVVGNTKINDEFGMRMHPILKKPMMHTGIDIDGNNNTVIAAQSGRVVWSNWLGTYGKCIIIDHGGDIKTLYGHNSELVAKKGENVEQGQKIAVTGSTGRSTGDHLHFEVIVNDEHQDPLEYLKGE